MKQILYFSLGAGIGAALTYYLTKRYYESIIDDEIESVKEAYKADKEDEDRYKKAVKAMKEYGVPGGSYSNIERLDLEERSDSEEYDEEAIEDELEVTDGNPFPGEKADKPYTIGPDSYHNEFTDVVDKETLTYWAGNDVLVTDEDEVLQIEDTIGREALGKFGEYEEDTVFVRNEKLVTDFEVIYMEGEYSD